MRFSSWFIVCAACVLLLGCGGGGTSSPLDDGGTPVGLKPPVQLNGLVDGARSPEGLKVLSSTGAGVVDASGAFALPMLSEGDHLALAVDETGEPVYLGFLSPGQTTLDARSTARVLLYYRLGGPFLFNGLRQDLLADGALTNEIDALAPVIDQGYADGGLTLADIAPQIEDALASKVGGLLQPASILVNPPQGLSGIDLDTTIEGEITLRNDYRRRAFAWVDRIEGVDADGGKVQFQEEIAAVDISPTTAYTSILGTLNDAIYGHFMWTPVAKGPIPLDIMPQGGKQTTYQVTVLGLGSTFGDYEKLSPSRQDRFTGIALQTILADFIMPIILNAVIPAQAESIDDFLKWYGGSGVLQDLIATFTQTVPELVPMVLNGDLRGAVWKAITTILTSPTVQASALQNWFEAIREFFGWEAAGAFGDLAESVLKAFGAVDMIGTALDSAKQLHDVNASQVANQWDVTVFPTKLTLNPRRWETTPGKSRDFQVIVQDPGDRKFEYRWSCIEGRIRRPGSGTWDTQITSVSDVVTYRAKASGKGEDVLKVEVYEINGQARDFLAAISAPVTVSEAQPFISPKRTSLKPGDRANFQVRMQAGYDSSETLFYRWSGGDQFGSHDGPTFIGTRDTVTYEADSIGVDTLACEVFVGVNGAMKSIGTATAEIRVEYEPTIIFGSYATHVFDTSASLGVYGDVVWPVVPGTKFYRLTAYGGHDPYYYGDLFSTTFLPDSNRFHDKTDEIPAGEMWFMLSGVFSSAGSDPAKNIAYLESRFAHDWIWEIEVVR